MNTYKINGEEIEFDLPDGNYEKGIKEIFFALTNLLEALDEKKEERKLEENKKPCTKGAMYDAQCTKCVELNEKEEPKPCRGCELYAIRNYKVLIPNRCVGNCKPKQEEPKSTLREEIAKILQANDSESNSLISYEGDVDKIISLLKDTLLKEMKKYSNIGLVTNEDIEEIIKNL